jgi:hypothetical protein
MQCHGDMHVARVAIVSAWTGERASRLSSARILPLQTSSQLSVRGRQRNRLRATVRRGRTFVSEVKDRMASNGVGESHLPTWVWFSRLAVGQLSDLDECWLLCVAPNHVPASSRPDHGVLRVLSRVGEKVKQTKKKKMLCWWHESRCAAGLYEPDEHVHQQTQQWQGNSM